MNIFMNIIKVIGLIFFVLFCVAACCVDIPLTDYERVDKIRFCEENDYKYTTIRNDNEDVTDIKCIFGDF